MPGRAATPLSDREVAELRAVPDAKTAGEAKASSSAGRGNSATVPDPGGPPSPTAGRRRKAPAQSLPAGSLSLFSRPDARATAPPPLPPPQQPGVEPDWPGSQVFGFGYNAHGQLGCGDTRARATPQLLRELGSISLTSLACGSGHRRVDSMLPSPSGLHLHTMIALMLCERTQVLVRILATMLLHQGKPRKK